MSQIAQQIVKPTFADPSHVSETYVNGPISINLLGPCVTMTLTVMRPDLDQSMLGQQVTKMTATVASKVTMPIEVAVQIRDLLNKMIQSQPMVPVSTRTQ